MQGVPLKVAMRGIDRYFERYYAKGPRRRPVRVDFCEADVLDLFDEWRRAVGIGTLASGGDEAGADESGRRQGSLPSHLERVIARLTTARTGAGPLDSTIDAIVRELDTARGGAKALRGETRQLFLERLAALDRLLLDAARGAQDDAALERLGAEADSDLAPYRDRMPREAYEQSRRAAIDRLIRERGRLPVIAFE